MQKKDLLPPVLFMVGNKISKLYSSLPSKTARPPERVCHFNELFINHNGDVFPCCSTWERQKMKIGNLKELDLLNRINEFNARCHCERYEFRKMNSENHRPKRCPIMKLLT
jgi:radical SAM protein with 4Fe4S-binding SPASM domain